MAGQFSDGDLRVIADITRAVSRGDITTAELQGLLNRPKQSIQEEYWTIEELSVLFTEQIERVRRVDHRRCVRDSLKDKLIDLRIPKRSGKGWTPFIIVIPEQLIAVPCQMQNLSHQEQQGKGYLNKGEIIYGDGIIRPSVPYFIVDVEDGRANLGKSPTQCEMEIKSADRLALVPVEAIALQLHTSFLQDHNMEISGARYNGELNGSRIGLSLYNNAPTLMTYAHPTEVDRKRWGSGSCKKRII